LFCSSFEIIYFVFNIFRTGVFVNNSPIPAARQNGFNHPNVVSLNDTFLEDGDFVRLKNIQLGYSLPKDVISGIGLEKFRVYIQAQNLLTITDYSGFDPEIGGDGLATRGIDIGNQPVSGQGLLGVQLSF